jgi:hypothetical protein
VPDTEVKIRGIRQLEAGCRRLFDNIEQATDREAIQVTATQAAATIRARVPKRTGRLASTVRVEDRPGTTKAVVMGGGLPYGRWIEFGAYKGRAPANGRYVYPTAKRTESAFERHCKTTVTAEIRRMTWQSPT